LNVLQEPLDGGVENAGTALERLQGWDQHAKLVLPLLADDVCQVERRLHHVVERLLARREVLLDRLDVADEVAQALLVLLEVRGRGIVFDWVGPGRT
jgi:hypothetical protein